MKKLLLLSALAIVSTSAVAHAEPDNDKGDKGARHEKMMEKMFEKDDANKDGSISKDEFLKSAETRFTEMDGNADGSLTKEEIKAHHEAKRAKWKEMKEKHDAEKPAEGSETPAE